jgi:hypothetical protein
MDGMFGILCDVAGLVTRGSDLARVEARRGAEERMWRVGAGPTERPATVDAGEAMEPAAPRRWLKAAIACVVHRASVARAVLR